MKALSKARNADCAGACKSPRTALNVDSLLIPDNLRIFLTTGVMGGLTTYSTFSYETVRLMETGAWTQAWLNIAVTTTVAIGLCFLGMAAGRLLVGLLA